MKGSHLCLAVAVVICCLLHTVAQGAEVRGEQSGRWTVSGSPYIVTGNIVIPEGATLTIEPGVIIKFAGYYSFKVKGTLRALGTPTNRIVFTSADDNEFDDTGISITNPATANDWIGIEFTDSSNDEQCRFENCLIRYCTTPLVVTQAFPRRLESLTIVNCSSRFVHLNGERIPFQNGVEQDFLIKNSVYQAVATTDSSFERTSTSPENSEAMNVALADSNFGKASTSPENAELMNVALADSSFERTSTSPEDSELMNTASADSSFEQALPSPDNSMGTNTVPADSSLEQPLTMPENLKFITAPASDNGGETTMEATPTGAASTDATTAMVQGVIADTETDKALPGATIEVISVNGRITRRAISGANGEFEFQNLAPGLYVVTASHIGHAKKTIEDVLLSAGDFKTLEIALTHSGIEFNPITTTASRRPEKVFEAPAAASVIDAKQIRPRTTLTSAEHLKAMPAVDFAGTGINQSLVVSRGFNNVFTGALLPLTDSRVARLPALQFNAFNLIPTTNEDIERIEIVSGPSSALYGPNSANGVMHLVTKSPFGSEGTTMSAGGGERISFFGSARHAASLNDHLAYKISGQYYRGKDWENFDAQEPDSFVVAGIRVPAPVRNFNVEKFGGEARVDFRVNDHLTSIVTAGYSRVSDIEQTGVGAMQTKNFGYGFVQGRVLYKNLFAQAVVNRINAGNSYLLRTGARVVDRSAVYAGQIQHNYAFGSRQRFIYGLDIWYTLPVSGGTIYGRNEANDNINEIGAFLQSETTLSPRLNLIGAVRADDHNRMKAPVISPRAALIYHLRADQNLRLTYNRAFSTPTANNFFLDVAASNLPNTPYVLRAFGVPHTTGLTFRSGNDGQPLMMSPFIPNAGYLPATANSVWPALRQLLISGSPFNVQPLLEATLPAQLDATVRGDLRTFNPATAGFDLTAEVNNVSPLKPTITNSIEAGYKGLLKEKLFLTIDVYLTRVEDFVGRLMIETPNVFANPQQLAAALQATAAAIGDSLVAQGLEPAQAEAQAAAIVGSLVASAATTPLGIISPREIANATDLILTYRNFGDVTLSGADVSFSYHANANWRINGDYSFVSKDLFPRSAGQPYGIALNAPKHKAGLGLQYRDFARGLDGQLRVRYVEGFPVNSGVYAGEVQTYTVVDLDCSYDLSDKTKFLLTVQDVFDKHYREFVGAPVLGRLLIVRVSHSL